MLDNPNNNICEVLHTLITKGSVSIMDFPYMSGFRTRISELNKMGLDLSKKAIISKNKFNNSYIYINHILINKDLAIKLYEELNNKNQKQVA